MLCEIKKRKRRKNCFVYFHRTIFRWEMRRQRERELKQTIKIGETTSFSRISSKPREFELSQFFSSTNSKHRLLYCRWFLVPFFFFSILIFSVIDKKKKKSRTNALSSSLPKSYFPPPCIYSPKESVWRRCSLPLYACRVIKDSSWKNSKVEEYRIAKYKYFLSMLPLGERSQLFPIRFALR